jgi:transmembrane sensor
MEPALKALGQRVAATQDEGASALVDLERSRARLLAAYRPRRWSRTAPVALAAAILLLVGLGLVLRSRTQPLAFRVGVQASSADALASPEQVGDWIAASEGQSVPITFSDGTELTLLNRGRARIVDVDARGASVFVERGKLRAEVVPRPQGHWRLFMGPYRVRVTGTKFDVAWEPESEHFELSLREGSVVVSGPAIDGERVVRAGEALELARPVSTTQPPASSASPDPQPAAEVEPKDSAESGLETRPPPSQRPRPAPEPKVPDFRELAQAGRYREALAASERAGFDQLCQSASAQDLMLLADVARLAGDPDRARLAYEHLRERFPGQDDGQAAFFLGRLAFDERADYAEAARFFELSLDEQPAGPLAREAAGRLIEARLLGGDAEGARAAARQYLERHADGPHARTARRLLATP